MITLAIILHHQLPIAFLYDVLLIGNLGFCQLVGSNIGLKDCSCLVKVLWRFIGQAYENKSGNSTTVCFFQGEALLIELNLSWSRGMDEIAVRRVRPGMITTHQVAGGTRVLRENSGAPVATNIM